MGRSLGGGTLDPPGFWTSPTGSSDAVSAMVRTLERLLAETQHGRYLL